MEGDIATQIKIPVKFKVKFPIYMQHEERSQFRVQVQLLREDPELKPTKLYVRWLSEVMRASPKEIQFPRSAEIMDPYEPTLTIAAVQTGLSTGLANKVLDD
jgi:hypothetical protein